VNVSIVIPTLNEAGSIASAVHRAWSAGAYEIIVADGGSDDETLAIARASPCRVVQSAPGRGVQQNHAARHATGHVLLFLHADNWLVSDAVGQIVAAMSDPDVLGGAFEQRIDADGLLYRLLERGNAFRARRLGRPFGDQGIFMRRSVFERLGGFPDVPLMEDVLLMRKFRRLSRPILLPGPLHVSPRRWQRHGVLRQTARNWLLLLAHRLGASPNRLAHHHAPHTSARKKSFNRDP
jgi:rSAM/selenodomain-associated transferase 2